MNEAALRLAQKIAKGDGIHQIGTLTPSKVKILGVLHAMPGPRSEAELAEQLGWGRPYIYLLASELADQGILVRRYPPSRGERGRPPVHYECACMADQTCARP